ncbi:MAG: DMT family transporter [Desulfobacter sp.]|nr:MAG: DMT family transporter [Desulfobacter sp.]
MLGSVFALSSAFFWALAVILFKKSGDHFSPLSLNIYKSLVAFVLVSLSMGVMNISFFPDVNAHDTLLLALSGFLGITLADIFFFMALNRLGASMVAVVECLYLPSVLFFSFLLLDERLGKGAVFGSLLVICAILVGSFSPEKKTVKPNSAILTGVLAGFLSMIFMAVGIVMIKDVLEQTNVFWATLVRVTAGCITLGAILLFHPKRNRYLGELKFSNSWITALPASVSGNFIALVFWVAGMKYTTASRAAILNQMSTIFIFILAAVWLKEPITRQRGIAICLAVTGAYLTIFSK